MEKNIRRDDWETLEPTVQGWGIVDVNYNIGKSGDVCGKRKVLWICPYYKDWSEIIYRCHSPKWKTKCPTYEDVKMCAEWRYLSNFIKWVDSQPNRDWVNCEPDKDLLVEGNKIYSPETVVYLDQKVNKFITNGYKNRGKLMLGVTPSKTSIVKPYRSQCRSPFKPRQEYLGIFSTELEAHLAWKAKKHEHACILADLQQDERVAKRLREMYSPDKDWTNK